MALTISVKVFQSQRISIANSSPIIRISKTHKIPKIIIISNLMASRAITIHTLNMESLIQARKNFIVAMTPIALKISTDFRVVSFRN